MREIRGLNYFSQALQEAAVERNQAFKVANEERNKLMKKK